MSKILVNTSLKTDECNHPIVNNNIRGLYHDNQIIYNDGNIKVTLLLKSNKIEMKRITKEYEIRMFFDINQETKGTYNILDLNLVMDLFVTTKKLEIKDNTIVIVYSLKINDEFIGNYDLQLEYEVLK